MPRIKPKLAAAQVRKAEIAPRRPKMIYRKGPKSKLVWNIDDQRIAAKLGYKVTRIIDDIPALFAGLPTRYERMRISSLLPNLTDQQILEIIARGEFRGEPFASRLAACYRQQQEHGWVGGMSDEAAAFFLTFKHKKANRAKAERRIARMPVRVRKHRVSWFKIRPRE